MLPLCYVGVNLIFTCMLLSSGFRALRFASSSMVPTLNPAERFIYDHNFYRHQPKQRGEIVVFCIGKLPTVKRIIAVGGDTIEGRERQILLNGQLQLEPFVRHAYPTAAEPWMDNFGPIVVPPGKCFVIGDNRDISLDSRSPDVGLLDEHAILGRALYSYHFRGKPLSRRLD